MKSILLIIIVAFSGCRNTNNYNDQEKNLLTLGQAEHLDDKVFLVTGLKGCGSCLDYTTDFIRNNIDNQRLVFIISDNSWVSVNAFFGPDIPLKPNFIMDSTMSALSLHMIDGISPKVFMCKDDKIIESFEVSYVDATEKFSKVKEYISDKM